ncbi:putative diguanylate cyclase YegE [compost metagenome]
MIACKKLYPLALPAQAATIMTLRARLLCLSVPLMLAALLTIQALSNSLLMTRFDSNDNDLLVEQANNLALQIDSFATRSLDVLRTLAFSQDTYWFAQNSTRGFHGANNIDPEMLRYRDYNFLIYFDAQGNVLGEGWDLPDLRELYPGQTPPGKKKLRDEIIERSKRLGLIKLQQSAHAGSSQLIMIEGVPVLLLSNPISNEHGQAAPIGNAVAGRFLGPARIRRLERFISGSLKVVPVENAVDKWQQIPGDRYLISTPVQMGKRQISTAGIEHIDLLYRNRLGEPEVTLRTEDVRPFYNQGRHAVLFFLLLATGVAAIAIVLMYVGLDRWVLRRIHRLHHEVDSIGPETPKAQLTTLGDDEIGQLTHDLNNMLERLAQSEDRGRAILDGISDGYFEIDQAGRLSSGNRALRELLGFGDSVVAGHSLLDLLADADDVLKLRSLLSAPETQRPYVLRAMMRGLDGRFRHCEAHLSVVHSSTGEVVGFRGILHDVTEQMTYQKQLLDMAYRDALTGLGNRKAFTEHLQLHIGQPDSDMHAALMFIDLDRFKQVNDVYGHDTGDALLIAVAERLRTCMRPKDRIFRLGGDEFTAVLDDVDAAQAATLANRMLGVLGSEYALGEQVIDFVTPSIGIALYPQHGAEPDALLKAADSAMYLAKRKRNAYCIYSPAAEQDAAAAVLAITR